MCASTQRHMRIIKSAAMLFYPRGILAQLGEHLPYKQRVIGSSPIGPIFTECARVAELADAQDLKSCCSDTVPVRFRSRARFKAASNPCKSRVWSFFIMSCIIWSHICVANVWPKMHDAASAHLRSRLCMSRGSKDVWKFVCTCMYPCGVWKLDIAK